MKNIFLPVGAFVLGGLLAYKFAVRDANIEAPANECVPKSDGVARISNTSGQSLNVYGSANLENDNYTGPVDIFGSVHAKNVVFADINAFGAAIFKKVDAHDVNIHGAANLDTFKANDVQIFGSIDGKDVFIGGLLSVFGSVNLTRGEVNELEAASETVKLKDVTITTLSVEHNEKHPVVKIYGASQIETVKFKGNKGRVEIHGELSKVMKIYNGKRK